MNAIASWKTTLVGLGLIASAFGALSTDIGNGMPLLEIIKTPEFTTFLGGLLGVFAKDANVTGVK